MKTEPFQFKYESGVASISGEELKRERLRELDTFAPFENHKVTVKYIAGTPFGPTKGQKTGFIRRGPQGDLVFFEGKSKSKYQNITLGIFEGFFATLTITEINKYLDRDVD